MQRQLKRVEIGRGLYRYRITVTGDPCNSESRQDQMAFLTWLTENQESLACGYHPFDKLVMSHNGICWMAEVEAEVEEAPQ